MIIKSNNTTAIVSHDAGGAEILSSYVRQKSLNCVYTLKGPAHKIFERKIGKIRSETIDHSIINSNLLICSTSWQSDIEFNAIRLARKLGRRSVAILDHWINYRERFNRSGTTILPDEIWVCDTIALAIAKEVFPTIMIKLIENPYLEDIQKELLSYKKNYRKPCREGINVLYVCEPIGIHALLRYGNARFWGYVEEDALRYFLSNISILGKKVNSITIRPHPSEPINKYNWVLDEFKLPIQFGGIHSLCKEIAVHDVIVGCESMAMVVALLDNKRVISSIPSGGRSCALPHQEIESLVEILSEHQTKLKNQ